MTSIFKYVLSTMGVSKESISKFLIGNRFHVKLRILCPYPQTRILFHSKVSKDLDFPPSCFSPCDTMSLTKNENPISEMYVVVMISSCWKVAIFLCFGDLNKPTQKFP